MPSAGFQLGIPAVKRLQTYALDSTATGFSLSQTSLPNDSKHCSVGGTHRIFYVMEVNVEDLDLVGCDAVLFGERITLLLWNEVPSLSRIMPSRKSS